MQSRSEDRRIRWPDGVDDPWPWFDPCWETLDERGRFPRLWKAHRAYRETGDRAMLEAVVEERGLGGHLLADRNTPDWGHPSVSIDDLVRITTDTWPAAGMDAPDVVLGPRSLFASLMATRIAVAGCAFVWSAGWPQSCFHIWCRGKPLPTAERRAQIRAVGLAPWSLWRVRREDGATWLEDVCGLGAAYQPQGPVSCVGEQPTGEGLAARVMRTDEGWVAHCSLDVPVLPTEGTIDRWLVEESWLARTVQPGITREALLRKRPVLVQRALTACFEP